MKKINFKNILDNKHYLMIISLFMAAICWLTVQITQNTTRDNTISDVPVNVIMPESTMTDLGLNPIQSSNNFTSITLRGPNTIVGNLTADNINIMTDISEVTEPGVYTLPVFIDNEADLSDMGVEVVSLNPKTATVRFDRLVSKTMTIEVDIDGISVPEDYVAQDPVADPPQVTLTVPQADANKISKVVVQATLTDPLVQAYSDTLPLLFLDSDGNVVNIDENAINVDRTDTVVTVRILKTATWPLSVNFTNKPSGFPMEDLEDSMEILYNDASIEDITVAGPPDLIDRYTEIVLGNINCRELSLDKTQFIFDVELPSDQIENVNSISKVSVKFDSTNWDTQTYNISSDQINFINIPAEFEASLITENVTDIILIGNKDDLTQVNSGDIVATIDLSDQNISAGRFTHDVKITVPNMGMVWATGDYSAIVQIQDINS